MLIQNLTNPALTHSIDLYTKRIIQFILKGEHGKDYFISKKMLESLIEEWKKRKLNQPV